MSFSRKLLTIFLGLALLLQQSAWALTPYQTTAVAGGRVVGVSDGDTLTVLDASKTQHKVRCLGIDAPEKAQPFGHRAKQHLSSLVFQKNVTLSCIGQDRYGRQLCKVTVGEVDATLAMVRAGMAWHNKPYQSSQSWVDRAAYAAAHEEARTQRRGLWADSNPIEPWEYRRANR